MAAFDLERFFRLREHGTTVRTELLAGVTTFLTMSYIVFVNPLVLAAAGVPQSGAIAATALGAAVGTLVMGLVTNYPFAMAAGMGLNAAVAFGMVQGAGLSWQTAMGVIVVEGLLVVVLVLAGVREAVFRAIPADLKRAIGAGIGLFLTFIGLGQANLVLASPATKVTFNPNLLRDPVSLVAVFGLVVTAALLARRVRGAMLVGIVAATTLAVGLDAFAGTHVLATGALAGAKAIVAWPSFETVLRFDLSGVLSAVGLTWVFSMLMTDFFDTMGTVVAVGREGSFVDAEGRMPRLGRVLLVDGFGAALGGALGVSSNTSYIESAAGVAVGGRTGLTSVFTAAGFALALFFSPVIALVPAAAVAPALVVTGFLMLRSIVEVSLDRIDEALPAFVTLVTIPLTFSIAHGIGYGIVLHSLLKLSSGRRSGASPLLHAVAVLFLLAFWLEG